jgi:hypothetical protein
MPSPHPSGDGATVDVVRPPLKSNVPCETQPAITQSELNNVSQGPAPQPVALGSSSSSPLPIALMRSSAVAELEQLIPEAKQQGLSVRLPHDLARIMGALK